MLRLSTSDPRWIRKFILNAFLLEIEFDLFVPARGKCFFSASNVDMYLFKLFTQIDFATGFLNKNESNTF